eukprot:1613652-Pleurochrysis_carterae.AAC.1
MRTRSWLFAKFRETARQARGAQIGCRSRQLLAKGSTHASVRSLLEAPIIIRCWVAVSSVQMSAGA